MPFGIPSSDEIKVYDTAEEAAKAEEDKNRLISPIEDFAGKPLLGVKGTGAKMFIHENCIAFVFPSEISENINDRPRYTILSYNLINAVWTDRKISRAINLNIRSGQANYSIELSGSKFEQTMLKCLSYIVPKLR